MKRYGLLLIAAVIMGACQAPQQRQPRDQITADPGLNDVKMVDIAVVRPTAPGADERLLAGTIRASAREVLIDSKHYAVPMDVYVDEKARTSKASGAAAIARAAGSDAGLMISLDEWETRDLIPKGRIYASGSVRLLQGDSGRVLWQRSFQDWTRIAPRNVTASNRSEISDDMLRAMIRDVLANFPSKPRR